jgi:hypothetical protein
VKRWCVGVALSVAAHGVVVAVAITVSAGTPPVRPRKPDTWVAVVPTPPVAAPIAIELLPTPVAHIGGARHPDGARSPTAMHVDRGAPIVESTPAPVAAPIPHVPAPWAAALPDMPAAAPATTPDAPPVHDGAFTDGTATFTMHVARDGTAHFEDKSNIQLAIHMPSRHAIADAIQRDHTNDTPPPTDDDHERSNSSVAIMAPMGATILTFDLTDWAMRRHGEDPYASRKLQMLDATRDERAMIGAKFREQQLARTPELVRANLDRVAAMPPVARKQALFELWNECDQTQAGEIARATIATYMRAHAELYTPDELAAIK